MTTELTSRQYKDRPCAAPDCDRILRSKGLTEEDAPGTYPYASRGMCRRCVSRTRPRRPRRGGELTPDQQTEAIKADIEAWLAPRRRRGIPAEGLRWTA